MTTIADVLIHRSRHADSRAMAMASTVDAKAQAREEDRLRRLFEWAKPGQGVGLAEVSREDFKGLPVVAPKDAPVKTYGSDAIERRRRQKRDYMRRMRQAAKALGVRETRTKFVSNIQAASNATPAL